MIQRAGGGKEGRKRVFQLEGQLSLQLQVRGLAINSSLQRRSARTCRRAVIGAHSEVVEGAHTGGQTVS